MWEALRKDEELYRPPFRMVSFAGIDDQYNAGLDAFTPFSRTIRGETHGTLASVRRRFREVRGEGRWAVVVEAEGGVTLFIDTTVLDIADD